MVQIIDYIANPAILDKNGFVASFLVDQLALLEKNQDKFEEIKT